MPFLLDPGNLTKSPTFAYSCAQTPQKKSHDAICYRILHCPYCNEEHQCKYKVESTLRTSVLPIFRTNSEISSYKSIEFTNASLPAHWFDKRTITPNRQHGVGCRYRSVRLKQPWFIQEDASVKRAVYFGILPGLYVGNFRDSKDQEQLTEHNITHIVAVHDNARKLPCNNDKEYLCIIASDSPGQNLSQFFSVCNDFIHSARLKGGNVLIHCLAGMSRSVTVAVVYIMCVTSLDWRDSLKVVQGARSVANPNVGFLKQMQEFEKEKLQDERYRLKEKFPDTSLVLKDGNTAKELLALYYHFLSVGEMCEGNCPMGQSCPRGLCHQNRSYGIFRRNSRESKAQSKGEAATKLRSRSPSVNNQSPENSPTHSRNPSPARSTAYAADSISLTPPTSPYKSRISRESSSSSISSRYSFRSPDISPSRSPTNFYGQPTPPGSPYRQYSYYTSPPPESNAPTSGRCAPSSPSRSYRSGKVVFCPSSNSPTQTYRKNSSLAGNSNSSTPYSSPGTPLKKKSQIPKEVTQNQNVSPKPVVITKTTTLSPTATTSNDMRNVNSQRNSLERSRAYAKSLLYKHKTKLNKKEPSTIVGSNEKSADKIVSERNESSETKSPKSSKFYQVVTRLLPQITSYQPSKLSKNIENPSPHKDPLVITNSQMVIFELCKDFEGFQNPHADEPVAIKFEKEKVQTCAKTSLEPNKSHPKYPISSEIVLSPGLNLEDFEDSRFKNGYFTALKNDLLYVETPVSNTQNLNEESVQTKIVSLHDAHSADDCGDDNTMCLICDQAECAHFSDLKKVVEITRQIDNENMLRQQASNEPSSWHPKFVNCNSPKKNRSGQILCTENPSNIITTKMISSPKKTINRPILSTPPPVPPRIKKVVNICSPPPIPPKPEKLRVSSTR